MEASPSAAATGYDNNNNIEMDDDACTFVAAAAAADSSSSGRRLGVGGNPGTSSSTDRVAAVAVVEREHMFDKVVTPSDVGKLNRLVIPKQHAEKYFPLDSSVSDKGLLLNFEDGNGKPWRFRYSYWNSSQSYVITKGWSRFVKEKKLDAGDIVSFQRGVGESAKRRLFIDWKRRPDLTPRPPLLPPLSHLPDQHYFSLYPAACNNNPLFLQPLSTGDHSQLLLHPNAAHFQPRYYYSAGPYGGGGYNPSLGAVNPCSGSAIYFRSAASAAPGGGGVGNNGGDEEPNSRVFESVPVVQREKAKAAAGAKRRLRLFGVNMDCPVSSEEDECNIILSSTTVAHDPTFKMAPHLANSTPISSSLPPIKATQWQSTEFSPRQGIQ